MTKDAIIGSSRNDGNKEAFMKNLLKPILSFLSVFILMGCESDEIKYKQYLEGTWQLVEVYSTPGTAQGNWSEVNNGYTYTFSNTGNFSSTRFEGCENGTFTTSENKLILNYNCEDFPPVFEGSEGTLIERLNFEGKNMILIPTYPNCVEGCRYKFRRL